ncbi:MULTISPECIES: hypothetical protein [unclassified Streptomyces]|uniref:hypothetical protein n=1 Tax=unclassified Streptomyces TaxID=2593676 RepID=UPI003809049A
MKDTECEQTGTLGPRRSPRSSPALRRTPAQAARDISVARTVRPLVPWTQTEGLRRLAFSLRPLIDEGMPVHDIAALLHVWRPVRRPDRPAAYIVRRLRSRIPDRPLPAHTIAPHANTAWRTWRQSRQAVAALDSLIKSARPRDNTERRAARTGARYAPQLVLQHIDDYGIDDAIDLYGVELTGRYYGLMASGHTRWGSV